MFANSVDPDELAHTSRLIRICTVGSHKTESTSWDHPYWLKIREDLKEHDDVRYAAYRTALKLRQLQTTLLLHEVDLPALRGQFEGRGSVTGSWEAVSCDWLWAGLVGVYTTALGGQRRAGEAEILADLALNLLLNLYDVNRMGEMSVMCAKIALVTLSSASLTEKYRFFYQELHDPSTFISRQTLTAFLEAISKIPEFLQESFAFGRNVEAAVSSCCQMGGEGVAVSEDAFYRWLRLEPQTLVWLPTAHRLVSAAGVRHDARCNVCKAMPIVGFRYRCLQCFNFDLCQSCFFAGRTRKKHKLKHPIQEYCINPTTKDDTTDFMKTLRNNLSRKHRRKSDINYLPIGADSQASTEVNLSVEPDVHREIREAARKLADIDSDQDSLPSPILHCATPTHADTPSNTDTPILATTPTQATTPTHTTMQTHVVSTFPTTPIHTAMSYHDTTPTHCRPEMQFARRDIFSEMDFLSPKRDGLQRERDELNAVIQQLQEENRALYAQLISLRGAGSRDSVSSEERRSPSAPRDDSFQLGTATTALQNVLNEPRYVTSGHSAPRAHVRSRLYLGVPVVPLSGVSLPVHTSSYSPLSAHTSPQSGSLVEPPRITSPSSDSSAMVPHSPPTNTTLGDELDMLSLSTVRSPPWINTSTHSVHSPSWKNTPTHSVQSPPWKNISTHSVQSPPWKNISTHCVQPPPWSNTSTHSVQLPVCTNISNRAPGFPQSPPRMSVTYEDSLDNLDASPSMFSLPSPAISHEFDVEEAELQEIVNNMDRMFPSDLSYSATPASRMSSDENVMLTAALTVGSAMSDFVTRAIHRPGDY